jgi:hypothetical protein
MTIPAMIVKITYYEFFEVVTEHLLFLDIEISV